MIKIVNHSKKVLKIARAQGWEIGARYTNLRDIKLLGTVAFIDIDWKNYDFNKHLDAVKQIRPNMTVARDIENIDELPDILKEAEQLNKYCNSVILVPKDRRLIDNFHLLPDEYVLGYSVPTKYGKTEIPRDNFKGRKVHLLGGRPDIQRQIAEELNVVSIDCNRFTLDAKFGDYFVGNKFIPHIQGGYDNCIKDSILNINKIWEGYYGKT